jgi:hypothetical protein
MSAASDRYLLTDGRDTPPYGLCLSQRRDHIAQD